MLRPLSPHPTLNRKQRRTAACGKIRYRDRVAALLALAGIIRTDSSSRDKREQRAYFHAECGSWHLTSRR